MDISEERLKEIEEQQVAYLISIQEKQELVRVYRAHREFNTEAVTEVGLDLWPSIEHAKKGVAIIAEIAKAHSPSMESLMKKIAELRLHLKDFDGRHEP